MSDAANITVSANEVLRNAEWILRGRGIDCGNEDEPARAVAWLALGDSSALRGLLTELGTPGALAAIRPIEPIEPIDAGRAPCFDAGGASALLVCPRLLDWLSVHGAREMLVVRNVVSPLWCLAYLALMDGEHQLEITARSSDGQPSVRMSRTGNGEVSAQLTVPASSTWGGAFELAFDPSPVAPDARRDCLEHLDGADLARAACGVMAHGLEVEAALWSRLGAEAYKAYVPASEESRQRGAGGGDDNE